MRPVLFPLLPKMDLSICSSFVILAFLSLQIISNILSVVFVYVKFPMRNGIANLLLSEAFETGLLGLVALIAFAKGVLVKEIDPEASSMAIKVL